jgi:hypothetical protein
MKKTYRIILFVLVSITLHSCATYNIPVDSFKKEFLSFDENSLKTVTTRYPGGDEHSYKTYPIDTIDCFDKNGHAVKVKIKPTTEIRFTDSSGKRMTFYFDLIRVNTNSITGGRSRILSWMTKTIPLNTIKKIELQDDHKMYRYVK